MHRYILRRLALAVPTFLIVSILAFLMLRLIPGDVLDAMVQDFRYTDVVDALRAELGLDKPLHVQYGRWLFGILKGDLGDSLWTQRPVVQELAWRYPVTLELTLLALLMSLLISIPIGIITAVHQDTATDYLLRSVAIGGVAIPTLWIATLALTLPSLWLGWAPPIRYVPFTEAPLANLSVMALPALITSIPLSGRVIRMMRAMMLEVLRQDYIRTAWAKGLPVRLVMYRHAAKNALIPVITVIGLEIPFLLGGTVIVEQIFALPGLGQYLLQVLQKRDYVPAQSIVLLFAVGTILINLMVDVLYSYVDPRIRYE
jgi:peptide/nickel transport system permease protein